MVDKWIDFFFVINSVENHMEIKLVKSEVSEKKKNQKKMFGYV